MMLLSRILEQRVRRPNDLLFVISESIVAVAIQNTTFGGIQGFTRKPSTPWKTDSGKFAGVVHQERGWTYALLYGTGHLVPRDDPELVCSYFSRPLFFIIYSVTLVKAFVFLREFVLGNNKLGSVISPKPGITAVVGGEDPKLAGVLRGQDGIYYGKGATQSTYFFPQATRDAWKTFDSAYQPNPTGGF